MINELLKYGSIDINRLLLLNYRRLNLDEVELVMIMHLIMNAEKGQQVLKLRALSQKMSIGINECGTKMQELLEKGYIVIKVEYDKQGRSVETYDLSPTYEKLEKILTSEKEKEELNFIIEKLEKELGSSLSPHDLSIVLSWKNYSSKEIDEAFIKAKENGVTQVSYINSILKGKERLEKSVDEKRAQEIKDFVKCIKR